MTGFARTRIFSGSGKKVIPIREVGQMSEDSKKEWTRKIFTEVDKKEFEEIGKTHSPEAMRDYQNKWTSLIAAVEKNLSADPESDIAQDLAARWRDLVNEGYGGHEGLQEKIGLAYRESWKTGEFPTAPSGKPPFERRIWEFIQKACAARKAKLR